MYKIVFKNDSEELYHYGALGQKWGVRNFQNPDGTLTEAGKLRYRKYKQDIKEFKKVANRTKASKESLRVNAKLNKQADTEITEAKDNLRKAATKGLFVSRKKRNEQISKAAEELNAVQTKNKSIKETYASSKAAYDRNAKKYVDAINRIKKEYGNDAIGDVQYVKNKNSTYGSELKETVNVGWTTWDVPVVGQFIRNSYNRKSQSEMENLKYRNAFGN